MSSEPSLIFRPFHPLPKNPHQFPLNTILRGSHRRYKHASKGITLRYFKCCGVETWSGASHDRIIGGTLLILSEVTSLCQKKGIQFEEISILYGVPLTFGPPPRGSGGTLRIPLLSVKNCDRMSRSSGWYYSFVFGRLCLFNSGSGDKSFRITALMFSLSPSRQMQGKLRYLQLSQDCCLPHPCQFTIYSLILSFDVTWFELNKPQINENRLSYVCHCLRLLYSKPFVT